MTTHSAPSGSHQAVEELRAFWDKEAPSYFESTRRTVITPFERACWLAALARALPPQPARVLDIGSGPGFLALLAAELGHHVTALDFSAEMLDRLGVRAKEAGVELDFVHATADQPPQDHVFDAVVERHVMWTLPDPIAALQAWRDVVRPGGVVVMFERVWTRTDPVEAMRAKARRRLRRWRREPRDYHAPYPDVADEDFPLGSKQRPEGMRPSDWVELLAAAGWRGIGIERLRDVEWAEAAKHPMPDRLLGVPPRFVVVGRR